MTQPERRKNPRFKVANLESLKGVIDRQSERERLVTLGAGGCGFYGAQPTGKLQADRRVFSTFQMEGVTATPIEVQGTIRYIQEIKIDSKPVWYYGVEFLPSQTALISPIIKELEKLCEAKKVELA